MKTIYTELKKKWAVILTFMLLFSMTPLVIEYWYLQSTSTEDWFEYSAIQVEEEVEFDDRTIEVLSFAEIKRPVLISWYDVLYCKHEKGGGYQFTASNESSRYYVKPVILPRVDLAIPEEEILVPWRFDTKDTLEKGDKCYIQSTISANLGFNIKRQQEIKSNTFTVK